MSGVATTRQRSQGPIDTLRRLLYTPPVSLEQLAIKLQCSLVSDAPRLPKAAFLNRLSALDKSLTKEQLVGIYDFVDSSGSGTVELPRLLSLLSDRYGKDRSVKVSGSVLDRVIARIRERSGGSGGIKGLARTLAVMDSSGDKQLSKEELKYGLANYGIDLNLRELDDVFSVFDRDHNGVVSLDELLVAIKGDLSPRRRALVERAFQSLDKDGSGAVTVDEMMAVYDASKHPDVVAGKRTKKEVVQEFMRQWDGGDMDGVVTYPEFEDYYKGVSASIDGDDYFELMIRNAWRIAGGTGMAANTANKRVLVTNKDGSQQVVTVENELGVRPGDVNGYRKRLAQQGVDGNLELFGGVDATEKAKNVRSFIFLVIV